MRRQARRISILALAAGAAAVASGAAAADSPLPFGIAGGDLRTALSDFSRATGVQVMAAPELLAGRRTPGVTGSFAPDQALQRLLAGTELDFVLEGGSVLLRPAPRRAAVPDPVAARGIAPAPPSVDEVVVAALRSTGKAGALEEKRSGEGIGTVMSAEEIAERPGGDIVDIISHIPGLSGFNDMGLGQSATGEQEYVTIRGIDSSYNSYTLNGVRVPQADPNSRALSLKLVAPYGLEAVKVFKSPSADMDGDAIGGSIDIRTPNAFDFDGDAFKLTTQGDYSDLAAATGAASLGGGGQVEAVRRFSENLGLYLSGYYDIRNTAGESVEAAGYTPTLASQAAATNWSAVQGLSATGVRYDYYQDRVTRYGGNLAVDYRDESQTWSFLSSYSNYALTGAESQHAIYDGIDALYGNGTGFSPVGIMPGSYFQERDETEELLTVKLGGESRLDRLTADYSFSYGYSRIARPNYVEASLFGEPDDSGSATAIDLANPAHTRVTYDSPATETYTLSQATDHLWKYQGSDSAEENKMYALRGDLAWQASEGPLDRIKGGVQSSISNRYQYQHQFFGDGGGNFVILGPGGVVEPYQQSAGPTVAAIPGRNLPSFLGGSYSGVFRVYDRSYFEAAVLPYRYTSQYGIDPATGQVTGNPGPYTANDYNLDTVSGTESIYAGYAEADFQVGDLRAALGLRYEYTNFDSRQWTEDGDSGFFTGSGSHYGEALPNLMLTWRPDLDTVIRGGIRQSFARPAFGLIAGPVTVTRDDFTGAVTSISRSNPTLKPTEATNYDLSAEFYGPKSSLFEIDLYYKSLRNFIYTATSAGSAPLANIATVTNGGVSVSEPENGRDADLLGMELNGRRRLYELPDAWSGLGVGGSLTLTHSSADNGRPDHFGRRTWLPRAPEVMGNLDLFYEAYGVKADLSYQYTGLQLVGLTSNDLDEYLQPIQSLDFSVAYRLGDATVTLAGKNLLDDAQFYKTLGKSTRYLGTQDNGGNGSYVASGRFITLSMSYQW